jgi:hypothetical protein
VGLVTDGAGDWELFLSIVDSCYRLSKLMAQQTPTKQFMAQQTALPSLQCKKMVFKHSTHTTIVENPYFTL